jgi:hypothetical protein
VEREIKLLMKLKLTLSLLFCLLISPMADAGFPDYKIGLGVGAAQSTQNTPGATAGTTFAFGATGSYRFADPWGASLELLSTKPIASLRASSYLASLDYELGRWNFGALIGIQALIDDRAATNYIDPVTGAPVKESNDGFTYGLRVGYDFLIPLSSPTTDLAISPSIRYLRGSGSSFYHQLYALLELKLLGYSRNKETHE